MSFSYIEMMYRRFLFVVILRKVSVQEIIAVFVILERMDRYNQFNK